MYGQFLIPQIFESIPCSLVLSSVTSRSPRLCLKLVRLQHRYQKCGQPVLIGGSMGTSSYVLVGTQGAMEQTFGSTCHGAGRAMSRAQSKKALDYKEVCPPSLALYRHNMLKPCLSAVRHHGASMSSFHVHMNTLLTAFIPLGLPETTAAQQKPCQQSCNQNASGSVRCG